MNQPIFSSPEDYFDMATKLHALIMAEFESAQPTDLSTVYPKLVIMYEFFRLIRGEAFIIHRPMVAEKQQDLYAMEDEIGRRLEQIRKTLDPEDDSLRYHIKEMQGYLDISG